jgi:hypothetical protein
MPILSVYTAAGGTPVAGSTPSVPGHNCWSMSDGTTTSSYGLAARFRGI